MCNDRSEKEIIEKDLIAYLKDHPDAQDTLEGIVEWWLLEQKIKRQKNQVKRVLGELVLKGLVAENNMGSSTYYRIKK